MNRPKPTNFARLLLAAVLALSTAACSGSSMDQPPPPKSEIVIGLVLPLTGPFKAIGADMKRGWDLYLSQHGNKLGGHPVRVVTVDEGDGTTAARAGIDQLLQKERASVVVGGANAIAVNTIVPQTTAAKVPFIGTGGRPSTLGDVSYTWHTSFLSQDYGRAIGPYLATQASGPVYAIGPDYQGGKDQLGGFTEAFSKAGGKLANAGGQPDWTPWPATTNFGPTFTKARDAHPAAVYCFYAGEPAIAVVKQYAEFGLKGTVPLYAAAFLTEGEALKAAGPAAEGIFTVANYSPDLPNDTNKKFAADIRSAYQVTPNIYHVTTFDAAALLDKAIAAAGDAPTAEQINAAIGNVESVTSPRGSWTFAKGSHSPRQVWYLRQVKAVDGQLANVVIRELGEFGG